MRDAEKMQKYLEKRTNFQIEAAMRAQEKNQDALKTRQMEERLLNSIKAKERKNRLDTEGDYDSRFNSREKRKEFGSKMDIIEENGNKRDTEHSFYLKNIDQVQP